MVHHKRTKKVTSLPRDCIYCLKFTEFMGYFDAKGLVLLLGFRNSAGLHPTPANTWRPMLTSPELVSPLPPLVIINVHMVPGESF